MIHLINKHWHIAEEKDNSLLKCFIKLSASHHTNVDYFPMKTRPIMFQSLLKPHVNHYVMNMIRKILHKQFYIALRWKRRKSPSCCRPHRGHCLWSADAHPSKEELRGSRCELMGWIEGKHLSVERTPSPLQRLLIFPPAALHLIWWMAMVCSIIMAAITLLKRKSLLLSSPCIPTLPPEHIKTIKAAP